MASYDYRRGLAYRFVFADEDFDIALRTTLMLLPV